MNPRVIKALDILPTKNEAKSKKFKSAFATNNIWVRASSSGLSHSTHSLGQYVKKGEALCVLSDPFGASDDITVTSPENAVIVGQNNLPLVHEGEGLYQLAIFSREMKETATRLEEWQENSTDQLISNNSDAPQG